MSCPASTQLWLSDSDWCIRLMGMWSLLFKPMVPASLVSRVVGSKYHGKGAGPSHHKLCHLGSYLSKGKNTVPVWQYESCFKTSAKDSIVMHLLCCLWFFKALFDIDITATHIAGINNEAADMLSRNQTKRFQSVHPHTCQFPTLLPITLTRLITPQDLDWLPHLSSTTFNKQYQLYRWQQDTLQTTSTALVIYITLIVTSLCTYICTCMQFISNINIQTALHICILQNSTHISHISHVYLVSACDWVGSLE